MNKTMGIGTLFIKYVSLNIFGMIGLSCYILADTFFVSQGVGADGLTALNLAIPIYSLIHGMGLMIGMGSATRFSVSKTKTVFTQALFFGLLAAFVFLTAGIFFADPIAALLGGDFVTAQMTSTYLRVILCFSPMFLLNNVLLCFVRNDGKPRLSMTAMLVGSLSNVVLDYIFIFPLQMGMFGAAFATGIAPVISILLLSSHFIGRKNTFHIQKTKPSLKHFGDISSLGAASLITELSSGIVMIIFNFIILRLAGNLGVAAYGIIANLALVVISIFTGIGQGMQPLLSKCYGKGDKRDITKIFRYGVITTAAAAILAYAVSYVFAEPIASAFNKEKDPRLALIAVEGLRIYFIAFGFVGFNIMTATFFGAVDKPGNAFTISILRGFVIIIPTAFLLSSLFGLTGIWMTLGVTELLVFVVSVLMIHRFSHNNR